MTIKQLTGGEAIVQGLLAHGVDTVFGLPGAQIYGLFDAFKQAEPRPRTIGARHEQGAAYMAFGYARATGKPGVCAVVPGPGVLNAGAALLTAAGSTTPVLCLAGQINTRFMGKGRGALHEMRDQLGTLRQIVKGAERIERPADAPGQVAQAFQTMLSGRRGPAALEMCWETFTEVEDVAGQRPMPLEPNPEPDPDLILDAAKLLRAARTPMVFVGGGALHASQTITALCEALQAPAVPWRSGRGIVDERHPLGFTCASGARVWPECDVALVIGTRFELLDMRWNWRPPGVKIIRIDIDPAEMDRLPVDIGIVADSGDGARALLKALDRPGRQRRRPGRTPGRGQGRHDGRDPVRPAPARLSGRHPPGPARRRLLRGRDQPDGLRLLVRISGLPATAASSPPACRAPWARAFPARWGSRRRFRTSRWSRSPATAASCSRRPSWPRRRSTA